MRKIIILAVAMIVLILIGYTIYDTYSPKDMTTDTTDKQEQDKYTLIFSSGTDVRDMDEANALFNDWLNSGGNEQTKSVVDKSINSGTAPFFKTTEYKGDYYINLGTEIFKIDPEGNIYFILA